MESSILVRALTAVVPTSMLLCGALVLCHRRRTVPALLQLLGAVCLEAVVFVHVAEALHVLPWMQWGLEHSAGHYLDLGSAVIGLVSFPIGYLAHALGPNG